MYITSGFFSRCHDYDNIDYASNHSQRQKRSIAIGVLFCTLIAICGLSVIYFQRNGIQTLRKHTVTRHKILHITDLHIDPYFDPDESVPSGGCHSCSLATSMSSFDNSIPFFNCPSESDIEHQVSRQSKYQGIQDNIKYPFGRYGCDPPIQLWESLLTAMKLEDTSPEVIIFTGDIPAHSYPDDEYVISEKTTIEDICLTKFFVIKILLKQLVSQFPQTRFAYAIGNIDHLPKDTFWRPYIELLGDMMLDIGFFTQQQHDQFVIFGSSFIDVSGVRYLCIDMTLFLPHGEVIPDGEESVVPQLLDWIDKSLGDAKDKDLAVYIVGHQPLSTRFGHDELAIDSIYYKQLKKILSNYASVIRIGFFGHNNVENMVQVLSPDTRHHHNPIFPAIVATGVSPRAPNQPSFHVIIKSAESGIVLDFYQRSLDLMKVNRALPGASSDASFDWETRGISWTTLSGERNFTSATLNSFLDKVSQDSSSFLGMELLKRGGYVGETTPELFVCNAIHDRAEDIPDCLFSKQNMDCWNPQYWIK